MVGILVELGVLVVLDTTEELVPLADCARATEIPLHLLGNAKESNNTLVSIKFRASESNSRSYRRFYRFKMICSLFL